MNAACGCPSVGQWAREAAQRLARAGDLDAVPDADWLLCEALGVGRAKLRGMRGARLSPAQAARLHEWLIRREAGEPLQYILGSAAFMGLAFRCDRRALIPRCDTEVLCERALARLRGRAAPRVLDLCAGGGAIGLSIAHFRPDARVTLADVSGDALALCGENMRRLGLAATLLQGDLFCALDGTPPTRFDLIACNPPYVSRSEMAALPREVREEPALALLGGEDGLDFYRRIARAAPDFLAADGALLLEVGAGQAQEVASLLRDVGEISIWDDLCGVPRVVMADRRMV